MLSCSFGYIVDSSSEFHFVLDSLGDIFSKESIVDVLFMHSEFWLMFNWVLSFLIGPRLYKWTRFCVSANDILIRFGFIIHNFVFKKMNGCYTYKINCSVLFMCGSNGVQLCDRMQSMLIWSSFHILWQELYYVIFLCEQKFVLWKFNSELCFL